MEVSALLVEFDGLITVNIPTDAWRFPGDVSWQEDLKALGQRFRMWLWHTLRCDFGFAGAFDSLLALYHEMTKERVFCNYSGLLCRNLSLPHTWLLSELCMPTEICSASGLYADIRRAGDEEEISLCGLVKNLI